MSVRVAVTGMGCVSGLGGDVPSAWARASSGDGAIRPFSLPRGSDPVVQGPAAAVDADDLAAATVKLGRAADRYDPLVRFAIIAAIEAVAASGLADHPVLDRDTAVLVGCGSAGNDTLDRAFYRLYKQGTRLHPQTIPASMSSAPASQLAMQFGIHGPAMAVASACASSGHALGEAMHMIRAGRATVAIAGGAEACLTLGSWAAWSSLGVLARDSCRPFSADRQGLVLGEGAAMLVLEAWDHAVARNAPIVAELLGYGATSDATHITAPDQAGMERAIRAAHADADLPADTPLLISSHGTGTRLNDAVEAAALRAVYGPALANDLVIATKSAHGHLIGGSGALELVLGLEALRVGTAPPILNHLAADPDCDLPLALEPRAIRYTHLLSNSFAFGGLNAVLIARAA